MILTGDPSTGKTSTILFLAKEIYKEKYNDYVLELNASDDRGLSIINDSIYPFCKKKVDPDICKLIILDEADSITNKAQNIFSKNIIIYSNTKFVFVCNDYDQIIEFTREQTMVIAALDTFKLIMDRYPDSDYAKDAYFKIIYLENNLAAKELDVAMTYLSLKKYISSLRRFKNIVNKYQTTTYVPEHYIGWWKSI